MGIMQRVSAEERVHASGGIQGHSIGHSGSGDGGACSEPCQERRQLPHHQLMTAALNKVESDMIYEAMLQKPSSSTKTSTEVPKSKAKAKNYPSREQHPDTMSLQSWQAEDELQPPTAESILEMMALMKEEQRAEMMGQYMSRRDSRFMNPNEEM